MENKSDLYKNTIRKDLSQIRVYWADLRQIMRRALGKVRVNVQEQQKLIKIH